MSEKNGRRKKLEEGMAKLDSLIQPPLLKNALQQTRRRQLSTVRVILFGKYFFRFARR